MSRPAKSRSLVGSSSRSRFPPCLSVRSARFRAASTNCGSFNVTSACNWRLAADSGFDPNHIFIHKDDAFLATLDRPFPIANRIRHGDSFHEIEERTGDGPKGLIDALGKAEPVFEFEFECDGEKGRMASKIPPNEMAHLAYGSIEGSIWLPGVLKVAPWPVLGMAHYEWYVPVNEKQHRYFIAWSKPTTDAAEQAAFREEVLSKWKPLGFDEFNATDLVANLGVEQGMEGLPYRSAENLYEGDGYTLVCSGQATHGIVPVLTRLSFDPATDTVPIANFAGVPAVLHEMRPVRGTHAHSWVMSFDDEQEAFDLYADAMPDNSTLLVDTYDTLEGARRAGDEDDHPAVKVVAQRLAGDPRLAPFAR